MAWWVPLAAAGAQQLNQIQNQIMGSAFGGSGGKYDGNAAVHQAQLQYEWGAQAQKWTYENQLPLIIATAKKAGIHPLAVLGQQYNAQPISISGAYKEGNALDYRSLTDMGQAVSRALGALDPTLQEREELINKKIQAEIDALKESTNPNQQPTLVGPDQVSMTPSQKEASNAQDPSRSAAVNPSLQQVITPGGILRAVYSERIGDAVEQDHIGNIDLQMDRISERFRKMINGLEYPNKSPHEVDQNYPKSWLWKKVRTGTGPAWKAVPHTRVPPSQRPGFKKIPHKKRNLPQGGYKWGRVKKQYR